MRLRLLSALTVVSAGLLAAACGSKTSEGLPEDPKDGVRGTGAGADGGPGGQGGLGPDFGSEEGGAAGRCQPNPANYEIPDNGCDDDGDGQVDNPTACDQGLAVTGDAADFAKALGLCRTVRANDSTGWGIVSATFSSGYGTTAAAPVVQHGILPKFGQVLTPREGLSLGVLSSGEAREYPPVVAGSPRNFKNAVAVGGDDATLPPGYPKAAAGCPTTNTANDMVVLKLQVRAPANAQGFSFDFNFFSGEWPEYVCTRYNDAFIAFLTSEAFNGGKPDNISFDSQNNPVSVNNGFFDRCTPNAQTGCRGTVTKTASCAGGVAELLGTGFGEPAAAFCGGAQTTPGGATGWLTTKAPVKGGEVFTLEFMIWDTGDHYLDSSVLLDNFKWEPGPVQTKTERPK